MPDAVSSDLIQALADKLTDFAESLSADEQYVLDRFFLQRMDDDGDVAGFGLEVDAVRAAKQHERDAEQALHSDDASRRERYESVLRKAMDDLASTES